MALKDFLTVRNLINIVVRIPLSAFLIEIFSQFLFASSRVEQLVQLFTNHQFLHHENGAASDLAKLQKMSRFWPPHTGFGFGEFPLACAISLILFLRIIDLSPIYRILPTIFASRSTILDFLLIPVYGSTIISIFLLPMMRLAEMHIFVLAMNFFHTTVSSYIVYFVWNIWKTREQDLVTEENEKKNN